MTFAKKYRPLYMNKYITTKTNHKIQIDIITEWSFEIYKGITPVFESPKSTKIVDTKEESYPKLTFKFKYNNQTKEGFIRDDYTLEAKKVLEYHKV